MSDSTKDGCALAMGPATPKDAGPVGPDVRSRWLVQMSRELAGCRAELERLRKREEESARALAECRAHAIALDEAAAENRPYQNQSDRPARCGRRAWENAR